jgi:lipoate-protein ligase A
MHWRLIPCSFFPPQGQMEFDRQLFHSFKPGENPVLRFFYFKKPTLTLGRLEAKKLNLKNLPYPFEIRPTGGWSVLHGDGDLCYSVVASTRDVLVGGDLLTSYRKISGILAQGLKTLGLEVALSGEKHRSREVPHCFSAPSKCELTLGGRKVAGGAQAREGDVFLQQGVILLSVSPEWRENFPSESLNAMTGINDCDKILIGRGVLEKAITGAFEAQGVVFEKNSAVGRILSAQGRHAQPAVTEKGPNSFEN